MLCGHSGRTLMSNQTEGGVKWIETQVDAIAGELGIQLDHKPEWDERTDHLNFKLAIEVGGQRKILRLCRPNIDDSPGGDNEPTRSVQVKLRSQIREFLESFLAPESQSWSEPSTAPPGIEIRTTP